VNERLFTEPVNVDTDGNSICPSCTRSRKEPTPESPGFVRYLGFIPVAKRRCSQLLNVVLSLLFLNFILVLSFVCFSYHSANYVIGHWTAIFVTSVNRITEVKLSNKNSIKPDGAKNILYFCVK